MQLVQLGKDSAVFIDAHGIVLPGLAAVTVNAIRIWTDRQGKSHFDLVQAQPVRDPKVCPHRGTWVRRGKTVAYTWARSDIFQLCCGDCGTPLA